jgi:NAD(P)-dependent dehydrogenase (short-subunit alcohol dehydrogenase family)
MGNWTAADIPDQSGRRAIVTGANSGLGFQVALELARGGARLVLACRNLDRGRAALERLRAEVPGADVELRLLDLADLSSVRAFAADVEEPIDLLVNNAGVMALPRRMTVDGFEMQLGTNHLGHFALTGLLLERLLESRDARVVTVASEAHVLGRVSFDDLHGERRYQRWLAYAQSNLANLLFCFELQRRAEAARAPLRSVAAHPGWAATHLQFAGVEMDAGLFGRMQAVAMKVVNAAVAQSDAQGALPLLYAATMELPGGSYVGPDGPRGLRGYPTLVGSSRRARDEGRANRLWEVSERLTGVSYGLSSPATRGQQRHFCPASASPGDERPSRRPEGHALGEARVCRAGCRPDLSSGLVLVLSGGPFGADRHARSSTGRGAWR